MVNIHGCVLICTTYRYIRFLGYSLTIEEALKTRRTNSYDIARMMKVVDGAGRCSSVLVQVLPDASLFIEAYIPKLSCMDEVD